MDSPSETIQHVPFRFGLPSYRLWLARKTGGGKGGLPRTLKKGMACTASPQSREGIDQEDVNVLVHAAAPHGAGDIGGDATQGSQEQRGLGRGRGGHLGRAHGNPAVGAHVLAAGTDVLGNLGEAGLIGGGDGSLKALDDHAKGVLAGHEARLGSHGRGHGGPKPAELCHELVTKALDAVCLGGAGSDGPVLD